MTYIEAKARVMEGLSQEQVLVVKRAEMSLGRPLMAWEVPNLFKDDRPTSKYSKTLMGGGEVEDRGDWHTF